MATNLVNPGSVWQSYNPNTGTTTYGQAPAGFYSGTGAAVATPTNLPSGNGTPYVANSQGASVPLTADTGFSQPNEAVSPTQGNYTGVYKQAVVSPSGVQGTIVNKSSLFANASTIDKADENLAGAYEREGVKYTPETTVQQQVALKPGQKIQSPELLKGLTEADIRRGTDGSIYRGSLQMEKNALADYSKMFGMPSTTQQWKQFNDYAYGGRLPNGSNLPAGARGDGGPTDVPAAPEIAAPDSTIDPIKLLEKIQLDLKGINDLIASAQADIDTTTTAYDNSKNEIGHELGTVAPLIQGEQAYQENQKQIQLQAKEMRLQRLVDEKANVIESGNLQLKVADYARQLRLDQQDALQSIISTYLEAGVPIPDSMASQYAQATGIDAEALKDGFAIAAKNYLEQKTLDTQLKQAQIKAAQNNTSFGKIGTDANGNDIYGFIDTLNQTIAPSNLGVSGSGTVATSTGDMYDISSYATDPNHEKSVQSILNNIGQFKTVSDIDNYIDSVASSSPITGQMVVSASSKYGVSWEAMVAMMQQDSSLGTAGKGARTYNPGNVGNTDSGATRNYGNWQSGVDAVAQWLSSHKVTSQSEQPAEDVNTQNLLEIMKKAKLGQGTKTNISAALNVMTAVQDLAKERQTEGFKGISPLNTVLDVKIPFTNIGLVPFREALRSNEGRENSGYIEAINLKVQQWASGAALTEQQTAQVARFTPTVSDTDEAVRTKLNNLYNFMSTQVQGNLQSEGVKYSPQKVDLFEVYNLVKKASPEQLQELKAAGLIQ